MRKINHDHKYVHDCGQMIDCFGDIMSGGDDYADELNMLMAEIKKLKELNPPKRDLEVGCKVTTEGGEVIVIDEIFWGEEAVSASRFYRWCASFPYGMEHAAMSDKDAVASVEWLDHGNKA